MTTDNKIYALGETVFDIVFKKGEIISGKAGGSVLNAAVSLARLGLKTELLSEIGKDAVGIEILEFLKKNKVSTKFSYFFDSGKTALALAFLNENSDAVYSFYKQYPERRFKIKMPSFAFGDSLIFGSSFALSPDVRKPLIKILNNARKKNTVILYDPNYRISDKVTLVNAQMMFRENIGWADIIRGSYDDFNALLETDNATETFWEIRKYSDAILIYTNGESQGTLIDDNRQINFKPHHCIVQNTIGAGDNFNAGILAGLAKLHFNRNDIYSLKSYSWDIILDIALTLSALVCASTENYISEEIARKLKTNAD